MEPLLAPGDAQIRPLRFSINRLADGEYKWVRHLYRRIKDAEDTPSYPACTFAVPRADRRASLQSSDETRSFAEA